MAKVGRNDPCPCGSGKKWKRCHGGEVEARSAILSQDRHRQAVAGRPEIRAKARRFLAQPGLRPGCYDNNEFQTLEKEDPTVIEEYAWHVLARARTPEEDERTRRTVCRLRDAIEGRCAPDELL